jgi:hypothetical protein
VFSASYNIKNTEKYEVAVVLQGSNGNGFTS